MQTNMAKSSKTRASLRSYTSQNQLTIAGFESPFSRSLDPTNRWVVLSEKIPWDELAQIYYKEQPVQSTGRPPLNARVVLGAVMIKHLGDFSDKETIAHISENIYMQYFLGYSNFCSDPPFDASLFVEIRKRLSEELLGKINMRLVELSANKGSDDISSSDDVDQTGTPGSKPTHKGNLLMDATVSPQDIAYPTDLNLLNEARQISEQIIDLLHQKGQKKPRTYRNIARKAYLKVAKSKKASRKKIRKAVKGQLNYLKRNLSHIGKLLDQYPCIPLTARMYRSYLIIQTLYDQQLELYQEKKTSIDHRIVSIWQPHVRPIVRGKAKAKTEFGAKIHLSMIDGFAFIDTISWDAFHEGKHLSEYVENYKRRFDYYPEKVLVDRLYCTRENRHWLKERGIKLAAKPLGRPPKKAVVNHVSPGERNPIEGKFGQAKTRYGMGRIKARLKQTSQSWIASIVLVLNLVNLTRAAPYWVGVRSFSVSYQKVMLAMRQLLETYAIDEDQNGYLWTKEPVLIKL